MALSPAIDTTIGEIARRVGEPIHRIEYIIRARHISPIRIAGNARVFSEAAVAQIVRELRQVRRRRAGYMDENPSTKVF